MFDAALENPASEIAEPLKRRVLSNRASEQNQPNENSTAHSEQPPQVASSVSRLLASTGLRTSGPWLFNHALKPGSRFFAVGTTRLHLDMCRLPYQRFSLLRCEDEGLAFV
jgi:hypothetical protein